MKRNSTTFFQALVLLVCIGALAAMLVEPLFEGRNINATLFEVYFKDPFLAYVYLGSIPFFVSLYQVFKLIGYISRNETFSQRTLKALRTIKRCGIMLMTFVAGGIFWIMRIESDDRAGGVFMGLIFAIAFLILTAAATIFERRCSKMT